MLSLRHALYVVESSSLDCAGPQVISEAYKAYVKELGEGPEQAAGGERGSQIQLTSSKQRKKQGLTSHVYQLGEFYLPCNWLSQELCAEVDGSEPKPTHLAGFHHWAGSWKVDH